jgi:phosphoribosylformylglycinamidine cyclo-ligase
MSPLTYREAGVNIDAGNRVVEMIRSAVRRTYGPEVLWGIGAFGGLYDAAALREMTAPVLVASTDGVGTKTKLAAALKRYDTVGQDLVNHCVNDILVQGARPLFFLDYFAASRLNPEIVAEVVEGCAAACRRVGCALLGGETAEMPGVYAPGEFDLAGTIVGVVERGEVIDGSRIKPGDVLIGLASTGLHTNGYSLARRICAGHDLWVFRPELGGSLLGVLLAVHRCYLPHVTALRAAGVEVRGLAHITGGGLVDNLPRIFPRGLGAVIRLGSWPVPPIFRWLQRVGDVPDDDMRRTFNLGVGLVAVVPPEEVEAALAVLRDPSLPGDAWGIGEIVPRPGVAFISG